MKTFFPCDVLQQRYASGYMLGCAVREAGQPYVVQWQGVYFIQGYFDALAII